MFMDDTNPVDPGMTPGDDQPTEPAPMGEPAGEPEAPAAPMGEPAPAESAPEGGEPAA